MAFAQPAAARPPGGVKQAAANKLSPKQSAFVEAYLCNGFNATKAAISAGYSEKTARQQGSRLLTNVDIAAQVNLRIKAMAMSADEALARLSEHAAGDMGDFMSMSGIDLYSHPQSRLIKKFKRTIRTIPVKDSAPETEEWIELELYDAQAALLALVKMSRLDAGLPTDNIGGIVFGYQPPREAAAAL